MDGEGIAGWGCSRAWGQAMENWDLEGNWGLFLEEGAGTCRAELWGPREGPGVGLEWLGKSDPGRAWRVGQNLPIPVPAVPGLGSAFPRSGWKTTQNTPGIPSEGPA